MVDRDALDQQKLQRKRDLLADRKERLIDNPKQRLIGIDTQSLSQQINDKQQLKQQVHAADRYYNELQQNTVRLQQQQIIDDKDKKRVAALQTQQFNQQQAQLRQQQQIDNRMNKNTYDIQFNGEDHNKLQREQAQKLQQAQWLQQQINNKQSSLGEEKTNDFHDAAAVFNQLDTAQAQRTAYQQYELNRINDYNRIHIIEKQLREHDNKSYDTQLKLNELQYQSTCKLLNEQIQYSPITHQPVNTEFKGFTAQQKLDIQQKQLEQIEQKKLQNELEQLQLQRDEYIQSEYHKQIQLQQRTNERNRIEQIKSIKQINIQQADQHKQQMDTLNKQVYTNEVKPEYFDQWGNSAR